MKDKKYRYVGPNSAVTIVVTNGQGTSAEREVMLWTGREVELPEDHEYTQQLLAQQLLEAVPQLAPAATSGAKRTSAASTTTTTAE